MQAVLAGFKERIRAARVAGLPLELRGGGSKRFLGRAAQGEILDTRDYSGVISYEPTELVITARAGTPLAEIQALLARKRQMLAFEPPAFGLATVGGTVAAGLSGPRRPQAGALRDHLLGVKLLDGRGDELRFGGQVMKNVAGYDVSRLMAGAMGTLGLLLEVSLKVLPMPAEQRTLRFSMSQSEALVALNRWAGQALPITASCWSGGVLHLRLEGARAAVQAARARLGGEELGEAAAISFWRDVVEQHHGFFAGVRRLWRISVPSTAAPMCADQPSLIEWGGALRWLRDPPPETDLFAEAARLGGSARLFRRTPEDEVFDPPLTPSVAQIQERLKRAFDPDGIFNRGRLCAAW
ncbi:glycolate oxidase subunit GlcE [Niveibacterium sp. SC-1]|uniref:glycolate oxidase subunit GlcE n=1 Tax=Niveibacterium sp. SC-1 TaxID=3135646 RepID=UPI00311F5F56